MALQFNDPTLLPIVRDSGTCVSYKKCFMCATRITKVYDPTGGQAKKLLSCHKGTEQYNSGCPPPQPCPTEKLLL